MQLIQNLPAVAIEFVIESVHPAASSTTGKFRNTRMWNLIFYENKHTYSFQRPTRLEFEQPALKKIQKI
jgi:hypothetical protein